MAGPDPRGRRDTAPSTPTPTPTPTTAAGRPGLRLQRDSGDQACGSRREPLLPGLLFRAGLLPAHPQPPFLPVPGGAGEPCAKQARQTLWSTHPAPLGP